MGASAVAEAPETKTATGFFIPNQAIDTIHRSPLNPRKTFAEDSLRELAESIKGDAGIIEPIVVRVVDGRYEIVAGERRWRAAKLAGLTTVPVIVRTLTDAQALKIMVLENDQREDLSAFERAQGYEQLMKVDPECADRKGLALALGRSLSWVHAALRVLNLIPAAQSALNAGAITESHALEIARLEPDDQKRVLAACSFNATHPAAGKAAGKGVISVRDLKKYIAEDVHVSLKAAPFAMDDAALVVAAGPCTTCPKRAGNAQDLFADTKKPDTCLDRSCYQRKFTAFLERRVAELSEPGKPAVLVTNSYYIDREALKQLGRDVLSQGAFRELGKSGECEHARNAVVVGEHGGIRGENRVCTKTDCKVHAPKRGVSAYTPTAADKRWAAQQQAKKNKAALERECRREVLYAIRDKVGAVRDRGEFLQTDDVRLIAVRFLHEMHADRQKDVYGLMGWPVPVKGKNTSGGIYGVYRGEAEKQLAKATAAEIAQFLVVAALSSSIQVHEQFGAGDVKLLHDVAKRWKVDANAIERRVRTAKQKPAAKSRGKAQTSARKAAKKR